MSKIAPWPYFEHDEVESVKNILISGNVNYLSGNVGRNFEYEFAKWCGCKYAIALANGSLALSSAYTAVGLKEGDEFITTPRTFIATSSTAIMLGAKPIFADVEIDSGNISAKTIEPLINKNTKAISVVHLGGWPADIDRICELAKSYQIPLIEDCSQAHGAEIFTNGQWRSVGSFGDASTWSFCQDKIISTGGEGGMLTTNDINLWNKVWSLKDHGKSYKKVYEKINTKGFRWLCDDIGNNFRLTELQSSIGRIQLSKISKWREIRTRNSLILTEILKDVKCINLPSLPENIRHAWYKFYVYLKLDLLSSGWNRERIVAEINEYEYPCFTGSCGEIYLEKSIQKLGFEPKKDLKNAKKLSKTSLMFCVHPTITSEQMIRYAEIIKKVLINSSK